MRRRSFASIGLMAAVLVAALPAIAGDTPARPQRIVSLDLCTDQLLVELVPRTRIAAVTHLAADATVSAIPDKALGITVTHGAAEDVLRFDPDLVLAGPFGVPATVDLLRRLGKRVVVVPQPQDLEGVRSVVQVVASAVGAEAEGAAMIADFDHRLARLAAMRQQQALKPGAIVYQVGGVVAGPGSLADAAIAAAGFRNLAREYYTTRGGQVPLEMLLAHPPDLLVLSSAPDEYRTALADNLRHPAVALVRRRRASVELPWRLWLCGTPHIMEAVEQLAAARVRIQARSP
ncbi:MAG: ABC transporter substrate-binding protein [Hyphomicrobiaceae bacterium]|nr:MAG: ABC transporter substrate-binding protein [Hyphomicrobiaceae bacterium]